MCLDIFIHYIIRYSDNRILANAYNGLCYLMEREDGRDKTILLIFKHNILSYIIKLDLLFQRDVIAPAIRLILNLLNLGFDSVEVNNLNLSST